MDGALILDVFAGGDNEEYATEAGARFAAAFAARARRPPGAVAAQAHDAALLVVILLTTVFTPPLVRWAFRSNEKKAQPAPVPGEAGSAP